ncbi:hypothetical protein SAMN04487949_1242 [Halogranum gelatinilyticum]|uniref:Uncharacterized protein n=1 Tax=Halogranum gelatinilyticum TaxID=660521 RepID=A0A1G9R981_9EURY|nr:hypothetical protein [Halogranum gelatinilyticum]SDM19836.1 hypothetical protein SAMN04487949_1242 [Halogranum gelatinilyticum]
MVSDVLSLAGFLLGVGLQLVALVGLVRYISSDATTRGIPYPRLLAVVCALTLVPLVYYVAARRRHGRDSPPTADERRSLFAALASLGAWLPAASVAPPDVGSQALYTVGFLAVSVPVAYLVAFRDVWSRLKSAVR